MFSSFTEVFIDVIVARDLAKRIHDCWLTHTESSAYREFQVIVWVFIIIIINLCLWGTFAEYYFIDLNER